MIEAGDALLYQDSRWRSGSLGNGVRYLVRTHASVDGRLVLRLAVDAGSLREEKDQLGSSFLTAMLVQASAAEAKAGQALLSLGEDLPAGVRATEAEVSQDAAMFTVALPIASDKAIMLGLRHLSAVASGAGLDDASIMRHRPLIRAQRAALVTRKDRLLSAVMPQIAPGSRAGFHSAVPSDATLCAVENETLRSFYSRCYAPPRLTIVAVGDAPVGSLIERIRREFGGLAERDGELEAADPTDPPRPPPGLRAAVAADPELHQAIVEVVVVHAGSGPIRTASAWRESLLDRVASLVLQRRLLASMEQPGSPVRGGGVRIGPAPGGAVVAVASVTGDPGDWRRLVAEVAGRVAFARVEGPSQGEVRAAQESILRSLDDASVSEANEDPSSLVAAASRSILGGDTLVSRADEAAHARTMLPGIGAAEVRAALASRFNPNDAAFILFMPDRAGTPPPLDILAAALPAMLPDQAGKTAPVAWGADHDEPTAAPTPGTIASIHLIPTIGVTSATLGNGVRFHHRRMTGAEPRVSISISIRVPEADAGALPPPIEATLALWSAAGSGGVAGDDVRRIMSAKQIEFRWQIAPGVARIDLSCPRESAFEAMRVIHLVFSEPRIDPAAFDRWRWSMVQGARARAEESFSAAFGAVSMVSRIAGRPSAWTPTEADIDAVRFDTLRRWVDGIVARGPIDAAMVGDIPRDEAFDLAATFLGSLPPRAVATAVGDGAPADRAVFEDHRVETRGPASDAVVLLAVHGAGEASGDEAALSLAARVLGARLGSRAAFEPLGAKPIAVKHLSSGAMGGMPLLLAIGQTTPGLASSLADTMGRAFSSLATEGPTDAELTKARAGAVDEFDRQWTDSAWWARTLSGLPADPRGAAALADARGELIGLTREIVRDTFAAHDPTVCCGRPRLRIVVVPAAAQAP